METISIDDVAKLDLRVGTILSCERVPDSKKLLVMKVDVGEPEPRQILGGIGKGFSPEFLVGKMAFFVCNLPPRTLANMESNGMIFACGEETINILSPLSMTGVLPLAGAKAK